MANVGDANAQSGGQAAHGGAVIQIGAGSNVRIGERTGEPQAEERPVQPRHRTTFLVVPFMILVGSILVFTGALIDPPGHEAATYWDVKTKQLLLLGAGFGVCFATLFLGRLAVDWRDKLEASYLAPVVAMLLALIVGNLTAAATILAQGASLLSAGWSVAVIVTRSIKS